MQRADTAIGRALAAARSARRIHLAGVRHRHDLVITRTGKPIFRQSGGRSSLGGHCVTVFGATGFLGRYIVNRLARTGCQVVIPFREEYTKRHLKLTGDLGRIQFLEFDLRNTQSIEESVRHSDIVINLIGREHTTKNFNFDDVHVEGTQRIAEAVAKYDCDRFIQVSSYNADVHSSSDFYRTKGLAEQEARAIFPETTIVRPSKMFGFEDNFLHGLAGSAIVFSANHLRDTFYPVHVIDVGRGLEEIVYDDSTAGETFELYGPKMVTMKDVLEMVDKETQGNRSTFNIPRVAFSLIANALDWLWWPTYSPDQVEREFIPQVIDKTAKTFANLGIEPVNIQDKVFEYVRHYRSDSFYDLPPMTDKERREEKQYLHVQDDMQKF